MSTVHKILLALAVGLIAAYTPLSASAAEIRSGHSNMCLDAWDGPVEGRVVLAGRCYPGSANQQFFVEDVSSVGGASQIRIGNLCLVPNAGSQLHLVKCYNSKKTHTAIWRRQGLLNDRLAAGNSCLDMSLSEGNDTRRPLVMWDCADTGPLGVNAQNQKWFFEVRVN